MKAQVGVYPLKTRQFNGKTIFVTELFSSIAFDGYQVNNEIRRSLVSSGQFRGPLVHDVRIAATCVYENGSLEWENGSRG